MSLNETIVLGTVAIVATVAAILGPLESAGLTAVYGLVLGYIGKGWIGPTRSES
jgi:hypothetical protein